MNASLKTMLSGPAIPVPEASAPSEGWDATVHDIKLPVGEMIHSAAVAHGVTLEVAHSRVAAELRPWLRTQGAITDGRQAHWRIRVRLFASGNMDEAVADSDADLPADSPGTTVLAGLPGVAEHLGALVANYHGAPGAGLDTASMAHRLKGLRPTLSRNKGKATWRVGYEVPQGEFVARVDILRED